MNPPIDPAQAAREELATPFRYHLQSHIPAQESLLERAISAVVAWLRNFFERLFSHAHLSPTVAARIGDVVLGIAAAVTALLLVRLFLFLFTTRTQSRGDLKALNAQRDHRLIAEQAIAAAQRGELARAVRLLFLAAVTLLQLRGAIRDDDSATVRELQREAGLLGTTVTVPFDEIARAYVWSVYAQRPVRAETWSRLRSAYDRLTASVPA